MQEKSTSLGAGRYVWEFNPYTHLQINIGEWLLWPIIFEENEDIGYNDF